VVKLLLAKDGVGLDFKNNNDQTPLLRAIEKGHEAMVELLLAKGNEYGWTPLLWAARNGYETVVKLLTVGESLHC
jgi:ankyrin repeat protein